MIKKFFISFLCLFAGFTNSFADFSHQYGIIVVPVADLVGHPLAQNHNKESVEKLYKEIPYSGTSKNCPRQHQAIFNEFVKILKEKGHEVKIQILSSYYLIDKNPTTPQAEFWTLRKNVVPIKKLYDSRIDITKFPDPLSFRPLPFSPHNRKVISLIEPFYDSTTQETYSAGTRFVVSEDPTNLPYIKVYLFDRKKFRFRSVKIPRNKFLTTHGKSQEQKIDTFISILKKWSHNQEGFIPYVLGGWSWVDSCKTNNFAKGEQNGLFYNRNNKKPAVSGLDCVGIIGRAAQICDIPFFFKNTTTMKLKMDPLKKGESLEKGDVIWYPGHVMVVSDVEKGLIIESRGYSLGYGKLHEKSLSSYFKNVNSFDQFLQNVYSGKSLQLLNSKGKPETFVKCQVYKMKSIWN